MKPSPVFYDASGKRRRIMVNVMSVLILLAGLGVILFVLGPRIAPMLPKTPLDLARDGNTKPILSVQPQGGQSTSISRAQQSQFLNKIAHVRPKETPRNQSTSDIVAAFYAPWQRLGVWSLEAHADKLTHVMPVWLHLKPSGYELDFHDWDPATNPSNLEVADIGRSRHVKIVPVLSNAENGNFDPVRIHKLFSSQSNQRALARAARKWLVFEGFQGINIDFENLYPGDYAKLPAFLKILRDEFKNEKLLISIDIEAGRAYIPIVKISQVSDFIVLIAYDEHYASGNPGPIASAQWCDRILSKYTHAVPPKKLVLGLGSYGYDWANGRFPAKTLTYQAALSLVGKEKPSKLSRNVIKFDPNTLNPTFAYRDKLDKDKRWHQVWLLDAVTAYNQWVVAQRYHPRGAALWVLGSEDPSIWSFLDRKTIGKTINPQILTDIRFQRTPAVNGNGEFLTLTSTWHPGQRSINTDKRTGLCLNETYLHIPSPCVIQRSGFKPKTIAITFDDGPSAIYTPQILRELKHLGVRATFFLIGENVQRFPGLVHQMQADGHEIGSHTFSHPNISKLSEAQVVSELDKSQRAIENATGKSTRLFRPPYGASVRVPSDEEVRSIALSSKLGYITVGDYIDPQDWLLYNQTPGGKQRKRTPEELTNIIMQQAHEPHGNVIVLHDGGGDRSLTIKVLRTAIPRLRREGYSFATVSQLIDQPQDVLLPPMTAKETVLVNFNRVLKSFVTVLIRLLGIIFVLGIVLGILRFLLIMMLAVIARYRERKVLEAEAASTSLLYAFKPLVSVIVPAYNEQATIDRTIQSVLDSNYPNLEIIVVDDGSTDNTIEMVTRAFNRNSSARSILITQSNSGKAVALNRALNQASGEILVCLDADTLIMLETIDKLARHFSNPNIASVAGNVKVGNSTNPLTKWQSIEYITSQNLDRRAYSVLEAITVIPGAIGAWRKKAVLDAGGYSTDTLAEDMDLTWRLHRLGWKHRAEIGAIAYTEAPGTMRSLFKQRFRWAYGTFQCLWKHKSALFHHGYFGWFALPSIWMFQVIFQLLSPLVDIYIIYTLYSVAIQFISKTFYHHNWQPAIGIAPNPIQVVLYLLLFFAIELATAISAYKLDGENLRPLLLLFWQRFAYRQILYAVIFKSLWKAICGSLQSWGEIERKGTVQLDLDFQHALEQINMLPTIESPQLSSSIEPRIIPEPVIISEKN